MRVAAACRSRLGQRLSKLDGYRLQIYIGSAAVHDVRLRLGRPLSAFRALHRRELNAEAFADVFDIMMLAAGRRSFRSASVGAAFRKLACGAALSDLIRPRLLTRARTSGNGSRNMGKLEEHPFKLGRQTWHFSLRLPRRSAGSDTSSAA